MESRAELLQLENELILERGRLAVALPQQTDKAVLYEQSSQYDQVQRRLALVRKQLKEGQDGGANNR